MADERKQSVCPGRVHWQIKPRRRVKFEDRAVLFNAAQLEFQQRYMYGGYYRTKVFHC